MFSLLINLDGGDLLQDGVVEGHVQVERNTVETLETEDELVKQKFGFLKLRIIRTRPDSALENWDYAEFMNL